MRFRAIALILPLALGLLAERYDDIGFGSPISNPDSKRVAYAAKEGSKWFVVVDGEEGKLYEGTGAGSTIFSPIASGWLTGAARVRSGAAARGRLVSGL